MSFEEAMEAEGYITTEFLWEMAAETPWTVMIEFYKKHLVGHNRYLDLHPSCGVRNFLAEKAPSLLAEEIEEALPVIERLRETAHMTYEVTFLTPVIARYAELRGADATCAKFRAVTVDDVELAQAEKAMSVCLRRINRWSLDDIVGASRRR